MVRERKRIPLQYYKDVVSSIMVKDPKLSLIESERDFYQLLINLRDCSRFNTEDIEERDWAMKAADYLRGCAGAHAGRTGDANFEEIYWKTMLFEAPFRFEPYLLYLERKRPEESKFYEPKMQQLNKHGIIQAMQDLEDDKLKLLTISEPPGVQKAQPLYSKVLTPDGFIKMGDVHVGTKVISGTGKVANVTGVYPQGVKPIYEVTFDDGSRCRCSDEHLWTVQTRDDRHRPFSDGSPKYRTVTLKSMMRNLYVENGKRANYSIDYMPKFDFPEREYAIHPYAMGVILGDGSISSGNMSISTKDDDLINRFESVETGYVLRRKGKRGCDYTVCIKDGADVPSFRTLLKNIGIYGKKSQEKYIPVEYLLGSHEQRLELLRGLMDTDGHVNKKTGRCNYATTSSVLARDVKELVNSLGGYASITVGKAGYKKDGIYKRCSNCYWVNISFCNGIGNIFGIERKAKYFRNNGQRKVRYVKKIEYIGEEECQCIYIDDPSHLYVTDNYVITHNTTTLKFFTSWVIGRHLSDYNLFFSHSGDITRMFYDGVLDITTNDTEYCWKEIFPKARLRNTDAKREQITFNGYKPFANLQCSSVGAKNAGKVRCNRYLFCDDLIGGIEEALSKTRLDKLWSVYAVDARQRKLNQDVKEIHIATRWSVHDVIGRLKEAYGSDPKCRFISVPDIDPVTGESNFDYKYNGMTKEFFHDQELLMDDISYRCLYKNEPIEREGLLYHEDDLRRYFELPLQKPDAILSIADTKNKGSDYFVQPVLLKYGEDFYLTDCICSNESDYEIQYTNSTNLIMRNKVEACHYESNNGGDRVSFEVNKRLKDAGYYCNITQEFTTANKETKIIIYAPWVKQHILFKDKSMYASKDDYGVMVSQLLSYSLVGKNLHDDVCDVLSSFAKRQGAPQRKETQIVGSLF